MRYLLKNAQFFSQGVFHLADNEGTKMGETRNRTGEYHDVGMLRARKYHIMKQQNPNLSR